MDKPRSFSVLKALLLIKIIRPLIRRGEGLLLFFSEKSNQKRLQQKGFFRTRPLPADQAKTTGCNISTPLRSRKSQRFSGNLLCPCLCAQGPCFAWSFGRSFSAAFKATLIPRLTQILLFLSISPCRRISFV